MSSGTTLENAQALNWIRKWGEGASSEALFEPDCHLFSAPGIDGLIGFRMVKGRAVVIGDPVCAPENRAKLAEAFYEHCRKSDTKIIYMLVSESFANWVVNHGCKVMLKVCDDLVFNPQIDQSLGAKTRRMRNKLKHAENLHLKVVEYIDYDPKIEAAMQEVGDHWLKGRKGPQIHLGSLQLFNQRIDRRWFYIKDPQGNVQSVALLRKLGADKGWFIKFLITSPTAPRGTSELLMISLLEILRKENCHYLSVGAVIADQMDIVHGLGKFSKAFVRGIFSFAKWAFSLKQRKVYWEKYGPDSEPVYILFSGPRVGIKDIMALMKVLNVSPS